MAPRANWKGYLRLSLVSCPIALYPATSEAEKIRFNQINSKTGNRIRLQRTDEGTARPRLSRPQGAAARSRPNRSVRAGQAKTRPGLDRATEQIRCCGALYSLSSAETEESRFEAYAP
jgi:hypothetical protein